MEWSLVLVSQGIETTITPPEENGVWALRVPAPDCERALKSLRQYRVENRGWPWRQELSLPTTSFDWGGVACAVLLVLFYALSDWNRDFTSGGIMDSRKVLAGEWWRMFTALMLHADLGHLATNLSVGILLFGLAMGQYGTGTGLFAAYLAGLGGNAFSLLINARPFAGLGASGMIMGALGLLAARSLQPKDWRTRPLRQLLAGVAGGVMLFVLLGLSPGSDTPAHAGGFAAGLIIGAVLVFLPVRLSGSRALNFTSLVALVALITSTWLLALRHAN